MPLDEPACPAEALNGHATADGQYANTADWLAAGAKDIETCLSDAVALGKVLRQLQAARANLPVTDGTALLSALIRVMQTHPHDTALVAEACSVALPSLSTGDGQRRFVAGGGVPEVLRLMHVCPDDGPLQRLGCEVLAELAASREHIKVLHAENTVDVVLAAMRWHVAHPDILQRHLQLLRCLTASDAMRQAACAQGALEVIVAALQAPECTAAVREEGAWALLDLVYGDEANARRLAAAGALDPLLAGLAAPGAPAGPCGASLKVVAHLVSQDGALQAQFVQGTALERLVVGMDAAVADAPQQLEYSGVLAGLATKEEFFDRIGEIAIPALGRTLRQHSANVPILTRVVFTLATLTALAANQHRVRANDGIPLLLDCLQRHPGCLELQLQCCKLMQNLAAKDEGLREDIILECGVKYICDVMQAHPTCAELQQAYLSVLVHLGEEVDVHRLI